MGNEVSPVAVLTDSDGNEVEIYNDGGTYRVAGLDKILNSSGSQINPATQETLSAVDTKLGTIDSVLDLMKDTDGIKKIADALPAGSNELGRVRSYLYDDVNNVALAVPDGASIPVNTRGIIGMGVDESGSGRRFMFVEDPNVSGFYRLAVTGKVFVGAPPPPTGGVEKVIAADTPLVVSVTSTISYTISNGKTFHIQQIVAGAEGDPTERGSKVEVYYYDGTSEHLVERVYVTGFTEFGSYPDTSEARDATSMVGDGSTKELRIKRVRLSGKSQEIDAVIRGYEI